LDTNRLNETATNVRKLTRQVGNYKAMWFMAQSAMSAANLPEPGLVMYGVVRNAASSNAHLISGTLTRTIAPTTGAPIAITTSLTNLGNQYSYLLRPP